MEPEVSRDPDTGKNTLTADKMEYREAVRKQLQEEIKNVIDLEMQKAAQGTHRRAQESDATGSRRIQGYNPPNCRGRERGDLEESRNPQEIDITARFIITNH